MFDKIYNFIFRTKAKEKELLYGYTPSLLEYQASLRIDKEYSMVRYECATIGNTTKQIQKALNRSMKVTKNG